MTATLFEAIVLGNIGDDNMGGKGEMVMEAGIAKFPAGRSASEAGAESEAAFGRKPADDVFRFGPETPLSRINQMEFAPGSTVLFKRGGVWRGQLRVRSGVPGHPVRYGAWGDGPLPVIQPSHDASSTEAWRKEPETGVWSCASGAAADIGNVILDGGESGCLLKRGSRAELDCPDSFWFDPATGRVHVRTDGRSPGELWRSVELAEKVFAVDQTAMHDVEYDSIAVRFGAAHGFGGGDVRRVAIRRCDVSWIGGGFLYVDTLGNGVRYGNGIELWGAAEDVVVEDCDVRECWDAGITNQSNVPGSVQRGIVWRRNRVSRCEYSYEFWHQGTGGTVTDVRLLDNLFSEAGGGWGHRQRWNPNGSHLMLYDTTMPTPGFEVRGNRFDGATECLARVFNDWRGAAKFDGNEWVSRNGEPLARLHWRPRASLRFLYPDRLDQIHNDDAAEIESQGSGGEVVPASPDGLLRLAQVFGAG